MHEDISITLTYAWVDGAIQPVYAEIRNSAMGETLATIIRMPNDDIWTSLDTSNDPHAHIVSSMEPEHATWALYFLQSHGIAV